MANGDFDELDDLAETRSGLYLESSPDDSEIEWESHASLRREQFRIYLKQQDELERDRLSGVAEADEQLFGLLQHYRYDDAEFLENLDPELAQEIALREAAAEFEASAKYEDSAVDGIGMDEDIQPNPEATQENSGQAMNLESKIEILERLAELRRTGAITEMEFEALKHEVLHPAAE